MIAVLISLIAIAIATANAVSLPRDPEVDAARMKMKIELTKEAAEFNRLQNDIDHLLEEKIGPKVFDKKKYQKDYIDPLLDKRDKLGTTIVAGAAELYWPAASTPERRKGIPLQNTNAAMIGKKATLRFEYADLSRTGWRQELADPETGKIYHKTKPMPEKWRGGRGYTWENGLITITPQAILDAAILKSKDETHTEILNLGILASWMLHEIIHFEQKTATETHPRDPQLCRQDAFLCEEKSAFEAMSSASARKRLGLPDWVATKLKSGYDGYVLLRSRESIEQRKLNPTIRRGGVDDADKPESLSNSSADSKEQEQSTRLPATPSLSPCYAPSRPGRRVDMRSLTPNPLTRLNQVRAQNQAQQNQRDLQAEANKLSAPYLARANTLLNTTRRCSGEGCWKSVYDQGMSLNRDILMNLLPQLQGLTGAAAPSLAPPIDEAFARMNPGKASSSSGSGRDYPSLCRKFELIKTFDEPSRESSFAGLPVDAAKAAEAERDYQAKLAALAPPPSPDGGLAAAAAPTQGALYRETPAGSVKTEAATNLGPGDTVRTGPNGKADLNLSNGHRVRLEAGTTLTLGQDEQGRSLYDVISGQIRSAIHCATGESPCALQRAFRSRAAMADATAAVRGTELALAVPASGPVSLLVREGLVEFRGKAGQTVWVGAGMRSAMDKTGSASVPETASPEELKDWFAGRAPQVGEGRREGRQGAAQTGREGFCAVARASGRRGLFGGRLLLGEPGGPRARASCGGDDRTVAAGETPARGETARGNQRGETRRSSGAVYARSEGAGSVP